MLKGMLVFVLAMLVCSMASAAGKWAVTASLQGVYLINSSQGNTTSTLVSDFTGASLSGVAVVGSYVFVADTAGSSDSNPRLLHVGQLQNLDTSPSIKWFQYSYDNTSSNGIKLQNGSNVLRSPGAVVSDSNGGIYILGARWYDSGNNSHCNYAYIAPNSDWSALPTVQIADIPTASFADIATTDSGALIARKDYSGSGWADQSWVSAVSAGTVGSNSLPDDGGYYPRAIAVGSNGLAYMANASTEVTSGAGPVDIGSISVLSSSSLAKASDAAIQLGDFRPTDIAFFTVGGVSYLGLVGTSASEGAEALRFALDNNGIPDISSKTKVNLGTSTSHYCTVSSDGLTFWVSSSQANTVSMIETSSWTLHSIQMTAPTGYIASYVPEPSSLMALLTAVCGLALAKRKRRA